MQSKQFLDQLEQILGAGGVISGDDLSSRAAGVWRSDTLCALAMARPKTTGQVSQVLALCNRRGVEVVTHGGLTGLVHGGDAAPYQLILSLERMREIENINPAQRTATVQAGVTLQALQEAVEAHELAFPLDLGARGTATLGGNAATNAGGNRVIRYGMMRDMVLGLEVALADGTVLSSLNQLIKNNTGYDLKQLFLGSEGTLGVITRLVLRLREAPRSQNVAFVAFNRFEDVAAMLKLVDRGLGGGLSAFEVMWKDFYRLVTEPPAKSLAPLSPDYPYYALIEAQGSNPDLDSQRFEATLEEALEHGVIVDAVVAQSTSEIRNLWSIRDDVEQTFRFGMPVVFDISLPISEMDRYVRGIQSTLSEAFPGVRCWVFGHVGDGNLHVIVQTAEGDAGTRRTAIEERIYGPLETIGGSVSAEHGIGLEKKPYLNLSRSTEELAVMRKIKAALDPVNTLNPGKIFDLERI